VDPFFHVALWRRAPQARFNDSLATRSQTELDLLAHIVARTPA
jgi:hypothetical protein